MTSQCLVFCRDCWLKDEWTTPPNPQSTVDCVLDQLIHSTSSCGSGGVAVKAELLVQECSECGRMDVGGQIFLRTMSAERVTDRWINSDHDSIVIDFTNKSWTDRLPVITDHGQIASDHDGHGHGELNCTAECRVDVFSLVGEISISNWWSGLLAARKPIQVRAWKVEAGIFLVRMVEICS